MYIIAGLGICCTRRVCFLESCCAVWSSVLLLLARHLFLKASCYTSKALVTSSDALVPTSFLLLLVICSQSLVQNSKLPRYGLKTGY